MAWCKASSLTAAVSSALRGVAYPATRARLISAVEGRTVEGWDLPYLLGRGLSRRKYNDLRSVLADIESWLEVQG